VEGRRKGRNGGKKGEYFSKNERIMRGGEEGIKEGGE
jgi:hypothetical protein